MKYLAVLFTFFVYMFIASGAEVFSEKFCVMEDDQYAFYFPKDSLFSEKNVWNPQRDAFPANLRKLALKANELIPQEFKALNSLHLETISIQQGHIDITGKVSWYLSFQYAYFNEKKQLVLPSSGRVLMLLDGTIAERRSK